MTTLIQENKNITHTLKELYRIYHELEKSLFDTPLEEPIILIQSNKKKVLGTCSVNKIWENKRDVENQKYEITVVAENLNRPIDEIVETVLHEMVHLYCSLNNIKDTSNNYVYHNKRYKEQAEKHGLEVKRGTTVGWAITKLTPETKELIKKFNIDETAFDYYRKVRPFSGSGKKIVYKKYICSGICETKLSVYKSVNLICGDCKKPFVERD